MPTKSRLRTTTRRPTAVASRSGTVASVGRCLPRHRPPTHPVEMLIEEFLKPLNMTQST